MPSLQPVLHVPAAPPIDTSPQSLGIPLSQSLSDDRRDSSRVKRISNAVGGAVDKLSKSVSGKIPHPPAQQSSPSSSGHRRLFSLSRKNKPHIPDSDSASTPSDKLPSAQLISSESTVTPHDDSPFVRPPSPPSRPMLASFRGEGSMRIGTQALIQALQALPWIDPDNEDEGSSQDQDAAESESEDDDNHRVDRLASSIHAIHRPLARSRRRDIPAQKRHGDQVLLEEPESYLSDEEAEQDFEDPKTPQPRPPLSKQSQSLPPFGNHSINAPTSNPFKFANTRTGSMATIRLHRRTRLAEKLRDVFELDGIKEVLAEIPCWLLRSVLLQGYMYLTNTYVCFFAHMPSREDQVLKSGSLNKRAQRTKRWVKHWFVLKNDALSWYQSSSDPYFPHGIIDLRYAISCEPVGEKEFRLRTSQKTIILSADSVPSREEWVKAIRKVIFKAQNMGDTVKIAIPYSSILEVERSSAMDFSETIEVKVFDKEGNYSVDSYFFAYFNNLSTALDQIRDAVRNIRGLPEQEQTTAVLDTTAARSSATSPFPERPTVVPDAGSTRSSFSSFRLSSLLRPISGTISLARSSATPSNSELSVKTEDFTHVSRRTSSFVPITESPGPINPPTMPLPPLTREGTEDATKQQEQTVEHTYPPSTSRSSIVPDIPSFSSSWGVGVPSWLKTRRIFGATVSPPQSPAVDVGVKEVYSTTTTVSSPGPQNRGWGDLAFSILETPDIAIDADATEKFRTAFAYDEKETLLGYFPGYIFRLLPVFGRLYISSNHFCFKSSGPLAVRTRMTLPIRDILALQKSRATRFGHHGLVVIVKGHEELFFEFGAEDKRDSFVLLLERQMEDVRIRLATGENLINSPGKREALILEEFERKDSISSTEVAALSCAENMTDSLPAVMFTSASSTFLTFKPSKPLHFTFLTIGSRGDVQPYISLAKGLMADGHKCRIATHGEFKEWIESYGIEFGYVGGDPAELMRICVENGTFTVSFLKEGLTKFRGWLDDLLKTSWEACQGTDVLVESPSAMGGYHIAEALAIPYFRAFTMTWTRTRAYPHAFAVPENKMGGSYNYMTYVMFDQVFWRAISGQINRWRRNVLHLPPTSLDKMEPHKIPFLYNFSPHIVPPPLDWPEWIRVTGYWFLNDADVSARKWTPPDDLVQFIDTAHKNGKKVVYIGFGSIVVSDPKAMTKCVIEAVVQSGVYAILSKGWSDRLHVKAGEAGEAEEPLPPQIYAIQSIPHDWLFQRIDAACHHGGAGTTGASLRAGIPTIIRPFFGDQFFWADRVEALGVGSGVRKLTVASLTEALITATTDQKQIDRARLMGEQIRSENGVATAIESIYRDLEYARSLIKHTPVEDRVEEADNEHSTIRNHDPSSSNAFSPSSSAGSARGAPSEDWSVISDQEDQDRERRSSESSRNSEAKANKDSPSKRASIAAAVLSVLPDSLTSGSPRLRTLSSSSRT
ncbi:glycosyltransferase family 1 protein [Macrolepiota fuliginosa MF-IS2]|uniref:Sterol 3-beta-glucosyltransferase n=1 Tax=Macrolepiota fuliginosa MF-IS2 TaxID=1400762 RepID=A0A9P5XQR2_9AGAR|nr:glycosyltransferase family 1 protein [Macrolepiota fuliginosa MF-IS2]